MRLIVWIGLLNKRSADSWYIAEETSFFLAALSVFGLPNWRASPLSPPISGPFHSKVDRFVQWTWDVSSRTVGEPA
jgi:hypothetical protein